MQKKISGVVPKIKFNLKPLSLEGEDFEKSEKKASNSHIPRTKFTEKTQDSEIKLANIKPIDQTLSEKKEIASNKIVVQPRSFQETEEFVILNSPDASTSKSSANGFEEKRKRLERLKNQDKKSSQSKALAVVKTKPGFSDVFEKIRSFFLFLFHVAKSVVLFIFYSLQFLYWILIDLMDIFRHLFKSRY